MKKILILLLVGVFVGSMFFVGIGCKVEKAVEEAAPAEEEAAEEPVVAEEVTTVAEDAKPGEGLVIYFQVGGEPGDPYAEPVIQGAKRAAEIWGCEIIWQAGQWDPVKIMAQFTEAIAAQPDGIATVGVMDVVAARPAFEEAIELGIPVVTYQYPLPELTEEFKDQGCAFFGLDMYPTGVAHAKATIDGAGLKAGDRILIYDHIESDARSELTQGVLDYAEEQGMIIDWLINPTEHILSVEHATEVIAGYTAAHPDTKAIITWHGYFSADSEVILRGSGYTDPDQIYFTGADITPGSIEALESGWTDLLADALLSMQGYFVVNQLVLDKLYKIPGLGIDIVPTYHTWESIQPIIPLIEECGR